MLWVLRTLIPWHLQRVALNWVSLDFKWKKFELEKSIFFWNYFFSITIDMINEPTNNVHTFFNFQVLYHISLFFFQNLVTLQLYYDSAIVICSACINPLVNNPFCFIRHFSSFCPKSFICQCIWVTRTL